MSADAVLARCHERITQPLSVVTDTWKASHPGGRAVAVYPVWAPAELIHAAGMLPLSLLGGGSSMDTAKGVNFLLTNGGEMKDYWGAGKATKPMLPLIAIPTTSGTGSECQSYALIADEKTHAKMACDYRGGAS